MRPYRSVEDTWAYRVSRYEDGWVSSANNRGQIERYEALVEYVETGVRFSISSLFRQGGGYGPTAFNVAQHVVKDMLTYGLIKCVKLDRAGRCLEYQIRDNDLTSVRLSTILKK